MSQRSITRSFTRPEMARLRAGLREMPGHLKRSIRRRARLGRLKYGAELPVRWLSRWLREDLAKPDTAWNRRSLACRFIELDGYTSHRWQKEAA